MNESEYHQVVAKTFRAIEDAFADVDPDAVELTSTGDVLTLTFKGGMRAILNTQRPVKQLWLAARAEAWHFDWDAGGKRWVDDRGRGLELGAELARLARTYGGVELPVTLVGNAG